jgi:hypothetical protein
MIKAKIFKDILNFLENSTKFASVKIAFRKQSMVDRVLLLSLQNGEIQVSMCTVMSDNVYDNTTYSKLFDVKLKSDITLNYKTLKEVELGDDLIPVFVEVNALRQNLGEPYEGVSRNISKDLQLFDFLFKHLDCAIFFTMRNDFEVYSCVYIDKEVFTVLETDTTLRARIMTLQSIEEEFPEVEIMSFCPSIVFTSLKKMRSHYVGYAKSVNKSYSEGRYK